MKSTPYNRNDMKSGESWYDNSGMKKVESRQYKYDENGKLTGWTFIMYKSNGRDWEPSTNYVADGNEI